MVCKDFKDLTRRTVSDKIWRVKAFNIAKNPKYVRYQCGFISMVYKFFDKRTERGAVKMKIWKTNNKLKHYTSPLLENLKKEKYTHLLQRIFRVLILLSANLITEFVFFYVIDIFVKYTWVIPLKDQKRYYKS